MLVPTVRHGDQFRRRLLAACGVALDLQVATPHGVARTLRTERPVASAAAARELLGSVTRRQLAGGTASATAYFAPLGAPAALPLLWAAVEELLAESVSAERFAAAAAQTGDPQLAALAAIYDAYHAALRSWGRLPPASLPDAAAAGAGDAPELPKVVIVDGFRHFGGGELRLLGALACGRDLLLAFDPDAGERARHSYERLRALFPEAAIEHVGAGASRPRAHRRVAVDREAQLRAMARAIKRRLTGDRSLRPSDCGVTFRTLGPVLGLARQVFAEYDLPLDPVAGEPLANRPLGVWIRRLLRLPAEGWRLGDLIAVLGSGFTNRARWALDDWAVGRIARHGREHRLWAGRDALDRLAAALRPLDQAEQALPGMEARGLGAALAYLYELLEPAPAPAGEHARRVKAALVGRPPLIHPAVRAQPGLAAEIDAVCGHLDDIAVTDDALREGPAPFAAFVDRLLERLAAPAAILREAGGVLLAPMNALLGLRLAYLEAGGLVEGEFPAPRSEPVLLSRQARRDLAAAGLALPPPPDGSDDELWQSVLTRADAGLTAWRTRLDERGRQVAASIYFDEIDGDAGPGAAGAVMEAAVPEPADAASARELAIACATAWRSGSRASPQPSPAWRVVRLAAQVEQRRRSFTGAGEFEGRVAVDLRPDLTDVGAVWSASRLESYRTCAFRFFGQYALNLYELDEELDAADPLIRGTVMHAMLEDALADLSAARRPLTPETVDAAVDRLRTRGAAIWRRAPAEHGFGRAGVWELECEPALERLEALLRGEAERSTANGVTALAGTEREVTATLPTQPPMALRARLDRLDGAPGLAVVVDYKSRSISRKDLETGLRLQLPLYVHAARQHAQQERVIARYASMRGDGALRQLDSGDPADRQIIDDALPRAEAVRAAVQAGDFRVNPQVAACPTWCPFRHVCRVNQFSRWKRWD